jgi:hypothetical protein
MSKLSVKETSSSMFGTLEGRQPSGNIGRISMTKLTQSYENLIRLPESNLMVIDFRYRQFRQDKNG